MYDYTSLKKLKEDYISNKKVIVFFFNAYLPNQSDRSNLEASTLLSEKLVGLSPAFVITPEFDPLKVEGKAYYKKLKKAGVQVKFKELKGILHVAQGHFMEDFMDKLNAEIAVELKKALE